MSSTVLESLIAERMHDLWLVRLYAWGASSYLVGIGLHLMSAYDSGYNKSGKVFSRESCLDESGSVVDDEVLLLVEEDLHILKSLLDGSHLIQIIIFEVLFYN